MEQPPASPQAARDLLRHDNGTPPAVNSLSFPRGPLPSTTSQWNHQLPADVRRTGTAPNQGTARAGRARTSSVAGLAGSLMQSAKDHPHNSEGWLLDTIFHQCVKPRSPACDARDARGADRSCTVVATEICRTTRKWYSRSSLRPRHTRKICGDRSKTRRRGSVIWRRTIKSCCTSSTRSSNGSRTGRLRQLSRHGWVS